MLIFKNSRNKWNLHTDEELVAGLLAMEEWAFRTIIKAYFPAIKWMVIKFNNPSLDVGEIFQEGIKRLIHNLQTGKYKKDKPLAGYFNFICRIICLEQFARPKRTPYLENKVNEKECEEDDFDMDYSYDQTDDAQSKEEAKYYYLMELIYQIKSQLKAECQEIIDLRFRIDKDGINSKMSTNKLLTHESIARKLKISNDNARQTFRRCLEKLKEMINMRPELKTLIDLS